MRYQKVCKGHLTKLRSAASIPLLILTISLLSLFSMTAITVTPAHAVTGLEVITTDQLEYMIGDTAAISGTNFEPNAVISIDVVRVDGIIDTGVITSDGTGSFVYNYYLNPNAIPDPELAYFGTLTVNAKDVNTTLLATTTFLDNPNYLLQGCSRFKGGCDDYLSGAWANGPNPMDGWTTGNVKGWYEQEYVPYRLRINLRKSSDAGNYFIMNEHDHLRSGVYGIDALGDYYIGAGPDSVYPEGTLTKNCTVRAAGTGILVPTTGTPCYVSGPIYSGTDDDGDSSIDEEAVDGIDNDYDGLIDEDCQSGSSQAKKIQFVTAVKFETSEAGSSNKRWALYWKAHLATGSSGFSGSSLHAKTTATGSQDVPISDVQAPAAADLSITKTDSPDPVSAGGTITYTITVTNNGPDSVDNVQVIDTLPSGAYPVTFVSAIGSDWTCSHSSGVVTCNFDSNSCSQTIPPIYITVTAPSPASQINITNTATVSGTPNDPNTGNNTATAVTTVNAVPIPVTDLSITKSDAPDPVNASGVLVYTLVVTNGGPSSASGVTVTDTLPAGVTFVSASGSGWSCSHSSGIVTCTKSGNLSNGATATITINVNAPAEGAVISNTASVTGAQNDPNNANNTATITTTVSSVADLSITKTDSPDPVDQLAQITYTITVSNAGPSAAPGVTVTDTIPLGSTYVSALGTGWTCNHVSGVVTCTRPSLGSGATAPAITLKVMAPNTAGTISNTVTVSSTVTDPNTANNAASAATTVNAAANLSLTKTDSPDPATAGQNITYTIVATNNGPNTANNVIIYDYLPPGVVFVSATVSPAGTCSLAGSTVTCSGIGSIANGATATATVVIKSYEGGTLGNGAEVTSTTHDTNTNNNDASATTGVIGSSDLSITKTDSQDPVVIGSTFSYTISVYNNGPSTAANVTVTDPLPAGAAYVSVAGTGWSCGYNSSLHKVTCSYTSLARLTAAPDITITVTAPGVGTTLSNTATVSSNVNDPVSGNNSSTQTTTVTPEVNLSISQTDLSDPVSANGTVSYTITVTNSGPNTATGVTVTNTLPAGTTFVSAGGTGWTCNESAGVVTCTMAASLGIATAPVITIVVTAPAEGGTVTNSATVGADQGDPVPGDNTDVETTTITPSADLTIAKTDSSDPVTAGANFTYTLTVTNNGPSTASTLTVSDPLPAGVAFVSASGTGWACSNGSGTVTCTRSSLAPGTAPVINIIVTAPSEGGSITNTASVSAVTGDPVPGNNSASQGTTITASSNLSISKADTPDPVTTNNSLTYTLSVNNSGPSTATGVIVTDVLPSGVTFGSATGTGWSCGHTAGVVTCTRSSLGVGAAPDIVITVTAPSSTGAITNTANITSGVNDPSLTNNNTSQATTVNPPGMVGAELSITQTDVSDPVFSGGLLTYTITVTNNGPDTATGVQVTDSLPAGSTFVSASGTGWNCTGTGPITCTLSSSLTNGSIASDITVTVNAPATSGLITNTASVSANETDPNPSNNTAAENTQVSPSADLSITKTDTPDPVPPPVGNQLTYTITVTNNGPSTATGVTMTDTLPAQVSYISKSTTQGTCTGTSSISCNIGTLANGASATITIVTQTLVADMVGNTATVSAIENDPVAGNNSATATTNVGDLSRLVNISTRAPVMTGDDVMIAGFIFGGILPKQLLIRARGPSLSAVGVAGAMANPTLEIYSGQTLIAQNDNWQDAPNCSGGYVCEDATQIQATGLDPCSIRPLGCTLESAILITMPPGGYTAILKGVNNGTGVGIVEVFDPDTSSMPKLSNISTRGMVLTGDSVMIGGFIIGAGNGQKTVLLRARGPSLSAVGVAGVMANPTIELYSGQTMIARNDDWQTTDPLCGSPAVACGNVADIQATGLDPCSVRPDSCTLESAIHATLPPGGYTVILKGVNNGTGVGIVEVFDQSQ